MAYNIETNILCMHLINLEQNLYQITKITTDINKELTHQIKIHHGIRQERIFYLLLNLIC